MLRDRPFSWARQAAGNKLRLGIGVIMHCAVVCAVLFECILLHNMDSIPTSQITIGFWLAACVVVFGVILPSWYLYVIHRLISKVDGKGRERTGQQPARSHGEDAAAQP
jgi:hypothetical protein